jgi:hypothetical protein
MAAVFVDSDEDLGSMNITGSTRNAQEGLLQGFGLFEGALPTIEWWNISIDTLNAL